MTLVEAERSVDDFDAFGLEIDGSEDRCAHDADCADDRFREEEPDGPGHHRCDECPDVRNFAGLVAGEFIEPCSFSHAFQAVVQDYAWSALLGEPEADEDGAEGHCSDVKNPSPDVFISSVSRACSVFSNLPA